MQPTKDSFYVALRDRLVARNPQRVIPLDGALRPAIAVAENEAGDSSPQICEAFFLRWGKAQAVQPSSSALMTMECTVSYRTSGSEQSGGLDRGRCLASLDDDLLAICAPPQTQKCDYSSGTPAGLGSTIFWTHPALSLATSSPQFLERDATLTVFFMPEVNQR
jgi:hypothetical protein